MDPGIQAEWRAVKSSVLGVFTVMVQDKVRVKAGQTVRARWRWFSVVGEWLT